MGLLPVQTAKRKYLLELEEHGQYPETELPIEELQAIFVETAGMHPHEPNTLKRMLEQEELWQDNQSSLSPWRIKKQKTRNREIIRRAKRSGTEIWLGDVRPTVSEISGGTEAEILLPGVIGAIAGTAAYAAASRITRRRALRYLAGAIGLGLGTGITGRSPSQLSQRGDASNRAFSVAVTSSLGKIDPLVRARNTITAGKVQALADKTGHQNIGLSIGSRHAGIATLLEKNERITREQKREISARGPDALKMFRCIYDKQARRWRVEEHSL